MTSSATSSRRSRVRRWITTLLIPVVTAGLTAAVVARSDTAPAGTDQTTMASGVIAAADVKSVNYQRVVSTAKAVLPKVAVIGTGGTIAGVAPSRSSFINYQSGRIPIADLVGHLRPEIGAVADVSTIQFGNKGSGSYTIAELHALTIAVEKALQSADGVVVTSGTDTMEELGYWLDLTVQSQKPVVMTGAMRPWAAGSETGPLVLGTDGPANLYNAIVLAASQSTFCFGTVLMLNDEFHAVRDVTKTSSYRTDTFQSREFGVLGWMDGPNLKVGRAPARVADCDEPARWLTPFDLSQVSAGNIPRVEVVTAYQQAGGEAITAFASAGVKGIVTAGTGSGGVSGAQATARAAAMAQGVIFISTTRTGSGSVYGGVGNLVGGDDLIPQKARLLLMIGLAFAPNDAEQIRQWVNTIGNPEWETVTRPARVGG